ncbi:TAM domain methyltransferase [Arthroderma uncinatum]|uniref:TAM domain methyltransferase n=1 Tax=Arthroderma uncinatum TaxID=74035 RepID=UPI00144AC61F|nr:TAM domain methyltransferase [Arthroderma uncinatum]KAF3481117.1 TAM domain methyltransferase [Arthroderma uncinatum]
MAQEDNNQQIEVDEATDMDDEAYGDNDEYISPPAPAPAQLSSAQPRNNHALYLAVVQHPGLSDGEWKKIENDRLGTLFATLNIDPSYSTSTAANIYDALDMQHAVFLRSLDGKLCLSPISDDIQNAIDIGTGTGLWALDFAAAHPLFHQVIGTDLSPIQPSLVPPNLSFLIDDAEAEWQYHQKFDLIHSRMLTGSLKDWDRFYSQCYENLAPGGYVEMQDICLPLRSDDGTLTSDHALDKWSMLMLEACVKLERPLDVAKSHKKRMEAAGFVDVVEVVYKWPQNSWAKDPKLKEIGNWTMINMLEGLQALTVGPFTRGLGWSIEEVETFLVDVRANVKDRKMHVYWPMYFVYGRKPEKSQKK